MNATDTFGKREPHLRRTNRQRFATGLDCATLQIPSRAKIDRSATGGFFRPGIEKTNKG